MRNTLTAALVLLALAACDGGSTGPGPEPQPQVDATGRVSFTVPGPDGKPAGTFNANGALSPDSLYDFTLGNWAYAELLPYQTPYISAWASAPAPNGLFYLLKMEDIPGHVQAGSVLNAWYNCQRRPGCVRVIFYTNMVDTYFENGDGPKVTCGALEGPVQITERTADRIKGTFSFRALCGVTPGNASFEYTVNDGSFDLPLVLATRRPTGG